MTDFDPFGNSRLGRKRRRLLQRLAMRKRPSSRSRAQIVTVDGEGHAVIVSRQPDGLFRNILTGETAPDWADLI